MVARQKKVPAKDTPEEVVLEGTEKIAKVAVSAKEQAADTVQKVQKKLSEDTQTVQTGLQVQLRELKGNILQKIEQLKTQLGTSQIDLVELKTFVKTEFNVVIDDLSKLGKELKDDVSQISYKHKDQLTETLKRSKESTLAVWKKTVPFKATSETTLKS